MVSANLMKLCNRTPNFLRHILKSKQPPNVTSAHVYMTYLERHSELTVKKLLTKRITPPYLRLYNFTFEIEW